MHKAKPIQIYYRGRVLVEIGNCLMTRRKEDKNYD